VRKASTRSRAADADGEEFDRPAASRPWWWRLLLRRPLDTLAFLILAAAASAIAVNGVYLQHGPHPAPMFAVHSLPVAPAREAAVPAHRLRASDLQPARRDAIELPRARPASAPAAAPARKDLIADLIAENPAPAAPAHAAAPPPAPQRPAVTRAVAAPSRQVLAVQHALSDFGFGQLNPTGIYDAETRAAVQRFAKSRGLPVGDELTDAVRRELAAVTGRNLD
jgi:hypothetical protein